MKYVLCHTTHHVFFFFSTSIFQTEIHYTHCCALFYYRVEAHRSPVSLREGKTGLDFPLEFRSLRPNDCYFVLMSSAHVQHDVLFLFTDSLLIWQALHYSSECLSRWRPWDRPLLSEAPWICISLCQLFKSPKSISNSRERCMINQRLKRHYFLSNPSISHPCVLLFPLRGRHASSCGETLLPAVGWTSTDIRQGLWEKLFCFL